MILTRQSQVENKSMSERPLLRCIHDVRNEDTTRSKAR